MNRIDEAYHDVANMTITSPPSVWWKVRIGTSIDIAYLNLTRGVKDAIKDNPSFKENAIHGMPESLHVDLRPIRTRVRGTT